jgi:hypothetical protein
MQKFNVEIKTHDGQVWFLETHAKGVATWTADTSKAKTFKGLHAALNAHDRTAKFAVCMNSCINGL